MVTNLVGYRPTKAVREAPTYRTVVTNYQPCPNQLLVGVEKRGYRVQIKQPFMSR